MALPQKLLLAVPGVLLCVIFLSVAILLTLGGLVLVRRCISHAVLKQHNDVAGFIFATLGVIYAVILAFTVIVVWENFNLSSTNVNNEAALLMGVFRDNQILSEPFKSTMRQHIIEYTEMVAGDEWEAMQRGGESPRFYPVIANMWNHLRSFKPRTKTEEVFFKDMIDKMNQALALRIQRIFNSKEGLNPLFWFMLILGGIITVIFTYFFGMENFQAQLIMTSLLAALIALVLFTILSLDYPFTGDVRVSPEPFNYILKIFKG